MLARSSAWPRRAAAHSPMVQEPGPVPEFSDMGPLRRRIPHRTASLLAAGLESGVWTVIQFNRLDGQKARGCLSRGALFARRVLPVMIDSGLLHVTLYFEIPTCRRLLCTQPAAMHTCWRATRSCARCFLAARVQEHLSSPRVPTPQRPVGSC
jgi:hypothetical protein